MIMEPQVRTLVDIADTPAALAGQADIVLELSLIHISEPTGTNGWGGVGWCVV